MLLLRVVAGLAVLPSLAKAQTVPNSGESSSAVVLPASPGATRPERVLPTYTRPTEKTKLHNYVFDAFGPYPIAGAAIAAGIVPKIKRGAAGISFDACQSCSAHAASW